MHESEGEATLRAMRNIRRHLTLAFLAVEQMRRTFALFPPAQRLCSIAMDALGSIRDEVVAIEARVMRWEQRERRLPEQFPEHPSKF
ncbi:MAG: hypothetical protein M3176_03160 [Chloroflexota bacterium]|nr:hypothetical protein [Chloroflexota bacterium]